MKDRQNVPARSPLGVLQNPTPRDGDKGVILVADLLAHPIHRVGHLVGRVACDILSQGRAVHVAPRPSRTPCEALGLLEHVIRDGDRGSRDQSISLHKGHVQPWRGVGTGVPIGPAGTEGVLPSC